MRYVQSSLAAVLILGSTFASAEIIKIDDLSQTEIYLNADSVSAKDANVSFFLVVDLKKDAIKKAGNFQSFGTFVTGDCKTGKGSQHAAVAYKDSKASGKMVFSNSGRPSGDLELPPAFVNKYVAEVCSAL